MSWRKDRDLVVYAHEDSIQEGGEKNLKIDNDTNVGWQYLHSNMYVLTR